MNKEIPPTGPAMASLGEQTETLARQLFNDDDVMLLVIVGTRREDGSAALGMICNQRHTPANARKMVEWAVESLHANDEAEARVRAGVALHG
jgi:hypothetical protein